MGHKLSILPITAQDETILQQFLDIAGSALINFRYFDKRPFSILNNHLSTFIIKLGDKPTAYGHLDIEKSVVWLGIAVAEKYQGLGLGKLMMNVLITDGRLKKVKRIRLSVDNINKKAIQLYIKMGFQLISKRETFSFLELSL